MTLLRGHCPDLSTAAPPIARKDAMRTPPSHSIHLALTTALLILTLALAGCAVAPRPPVPAVAASAAQAAESTPVRAATAPTPTVATSVSTAPTAHDAGHVLHPAAGALPAVEPAARRHLAATIDAYIGQPRFSAARWGIVVEDLDTGDMLYRHQADTLFIPASNAKLYTAALALGELGPDHRFHTSLYASRRPSARGVLDGDLLLYGRGDPGLGMGTDDTTPQAWADQFAAALYARGVRRVRGNLIADDTWYAGPPYGAGWEAADLLGGFAPRVSALSVQDNAFTLRIGGNGRCCTVRTDPAAIGLDIVNTLQLRSAGRDEPLGLYRPLGSDQLFIFGSRPATERPRTFTLAAPDPARLAGVLLVDAMARRGIRFDGQVRVRHWPEQTDAKALLAMTRITDVRSAPLDALIGHMLKESDNLYAQLLLLAVGKQQAASGICLDQRQPPDLTASWGLCAMRAWLRGIGIGPGDALFEEGSGLSRKDRVTPLATVRLLAWLDRQPYAADIDQALPVAGVDGTLRYRMREGFASGNLHAKTGTLHLAYTLSGYVRAANGHRLAFSIMLNGYARPRDLDGTPLAPRPTQDIDAIAEQLARYGQVPLGATMPAGAASSAAPSAPGAAGRY